MFYCILWYHSISYFISYHAMLYYIISCSIMLYSIILYRNISCDIAYIHSTFNSTDAFINWVWRLQKYPDMDRDMEWYRQMGVEICQPLDGVSQLQQRDQCPILLSKSKVVKVCKVEILTLRSYCRTRTALSGCLRRASALHLHVAFVSFWLHLRSTPQQISVKSRITIHKIHATITSKLHSHELIWIWW